MNPIIRHAAVLVLALAALPLQAETAIDQLLGLRAYELADAYWAAGQRFADLGQKDRAAEFQAKAKRLFPGYVPGQAPAAQVGQAVPRTPAPHVPAVAEVREQNLQGQKVARLQFQKLLRGYLTGSAATVGSVLGASLEVQGQPSTPDADALAAFLTTHPATAGTPNDLFLSGSLDVVDGMGQSVLVTVTANPEAADLAALLPFWKSQQTYTFDRVGDTWKLVKIEGRD